MELGVSFAAKNAEDAKGESCECESFFNAEAQRRREAESKIKKDSSSIYTFYTLYTAKKGFAPNPKP